MSKMEDVWLENCSSVISFELVHKAVFESKYSCRRRNSKTLNTLKLHEFFFVRMHGDKCELKWKISMLTVANNELASNRAASANAVSKSR